MPQNKASENGGELPIIQPFENHPKTPQRKSGRGRIRACVLIFVHVVILVHITHYLVSDRSLSPVEPSESMYAIELGLLNAGTIFFGTAIISTMIFGRFFCGWGCHLVALQDLCGYLLRRIAIRPKPLRSRLLVLVPFALAFYMFCWPTLQRLWRGDQHPGFSNHLMTENFWQTFPGPFVSILTFVVCGGLIVYLLGNKGFCTYACPYGAFFSIADRVAVGRIRVTNACHQCGQCTANCTSNVVVHAEVRDFGMVVDPGCMKCMDCVSVCPNDALYFGFTKRKGQEKSSDVLPKSSKPHRRRKSYDFSITEELFGLFVAAVSVYAIRGLYNVPPLLLAVAVGVMTAYLAVQFGRMFRKRDVRTQNIQFKRKGRITKMGWWAVVLLSMWFVFIIHSCFVQYHLYRGRDHLSRISTTWLELLDGQPTQPFTVEELADIDAALKSFQLTDRFGIADVLEVKLGLVYTNMMNGDMEVAEKYLRQAYDCNPPAARELLAEFLLSQGRQKEAEELFREES